MPTDPRSLRSDAPLLDAWLRFHEATPTPFTIPGHKHRLDLVGDVVAGDVPLYGGLDTMKLSAGVLAEAQARAARAQVSAARAQQSAPPAPLEWKPLRSEAPPWAHWPTRMAPRATS